MNPEEIDAWYEERKQELLNKYVKALEDKKDRKKIETEFNIEMDRLHQRYEAKYKRINMHPILKKDISKFNAFMNKLSDIYS